MARQTDSKLRVNVEEQLERLVKQLEDLENYKDDLEEDEYRETREETLEQMNEFQLSLSKLAAGDLSLVDRFASIRLAIQAAVGGAFRTPEVIRLFAGRRPGELRQRLAQLQRDLKLAKVSAEEAGQRQVEILVALKGLGETLSAEESALIERDGSLPLRQFVAVSTSSTSSASSKLLALAQSCLADTLPSVDP